MRIAVLGGTFDPVHCGHLHIARGIRRVFELDSVIFMVSRQPPHKGRNRISDAHHRYAMTVLALMDEENMSASGLELNREGPSYTVDTMEKLAIQNPKSRFCFAGGTDSLKEIHLWHEYGKLLSNNCMAFIQRPGERIQEDQLELLRQFGRSIKVLSGERQPDLSPGNCYLVELDSPAVSSTEVRKLISSGEEVPVDWIPPRVQQYIRKYQLYR